MDYLADSSVVVSVDNKVATVVVGGGGVEMLICVLAALVVLRLEHQRRGGAGPFLGSWSTDSARRLLKECAPEAALLLSCLSLAALMRSRGEGHVAMDEESQAAWDQIKAEWPLLVTADTLLSLQAMLRLVALLAVVLRLGGISPVPLSQEAALLGFFAVSARVAVFCLTDSYLLDGPLGGKVPVACEVAVLPMLFLLGIRSLRRSWWTMTLAVIAVGFYASRNRLGLAHEGDDYSDSLFIAAHCFETLAAFVYLGRSALCEGMGCDASTGFTHLLMPVQQGLSTYFFLSAFSTTENLVGRGRPFDVLQVGSAAAIGAYLAAAALFAAEHADAPRPVEV